MLSYEEVQRRINGTPKLFNGNFTTAASATYTLPIEKNTVIRITVADEAYMKIIPELAFGGYFGAKADHAVGSNADETVLLNTNVYDNPAHIWASPSAVTIPGDGPQEGASLLSPANGGIIDGTDVDAGDGSITLARDQATQSHVLEWALEDQAVLRWPLNMFPGRAGRPGRQRSVRGGQTAGIFRTRSIESSASYGLDWTLKAIELDDGAVTYWDDGAGAWTATLADAWTAIDDEVTTHVEALSFNTPTNDALLELWLRSTDGATATGETCRLYAVSVHEPIEQYQGVRLGTIGEAYYFVVPQRSVLGFWADGASTATIEIME
jgi:hypothetical protein